ncbi:DUF3048 domain-containing protein [Timonella sp. A28]|uniref:DUF3048 domain-containing protein n=1 Tax=Timonella sp. A28 TaxID=3442640 RepID=UPI003EB72B02
MSDRHVARVPMNRLVGMSMVAVLSASLITACSKEPEPAPTTPSTTPAATASATPTPTPEPEPEPVVWPLTGKESDSVKNRPAVAVKVENTAAARPQSGLEDADVVWETIVEFEVSRFIAVYHSKYPKEIGPIRSVRPMDVRVVSPLGGAFIYSGGQTGILKLVAKDKNIEAFDENSAASALWRSRYRAAPHNLYGDVSGFAKLVSKKNADSPEEQFTFADKLSNATAVEDGKKASTVSLRMSTSSSPKWTWDSKTKKWLRSEGTFKAVAASGKRLSATNVVVVRARHFDSGFDAQNRAPVPDYDLTGTGTGVVATGGKTLEVKWTKKDNSSPLTLHDEDGNPVDLAPGNTWVELLPKKTGKITID